MKRTLPILILAAVLCGEAVKAASISTIGFHQDSEPASTSQPQPIEAGFVSIAEGEVSILRQGSPTWQSLTFGQMVEIGDALRTGDSARAEILLTPGSCLHLSANSEAIFADAGLDFLAIESKVGSFNLNWFGTQNTETVVALTAKDRQLAVFPGSSCQLNVTPDKPAEFKLWEGNAVVFNIPKGNVKAGQCLRFDSQSVVIQPMLLTETVPAENHKQPQMEDQKPSRQVWPNPGSNPHFLWFGLRSYFEPHDFVKYLQAQPLSRGGRVSYVQGQVQVRRKTETQWIPLHVGDALNDEDAVSTGSYSRLEVLVGQGSVVQLGDRSSCVFLNTAFRRIMLQLIQGQVIIDLPGYDSTRVEPAVIVAQTRVQLQRKGSYRFRIASPDQAEVQFQPGKLTIQGTSGVMKGPQKISLVNGRVREKSKEPSPNTEFERWSQYRAAILFACMDKLTYDRNWAKLQKETPIGNWIYDPAEPGRLGTTLTGMEGYVNQPPIGRWVLKGNQVSFISYFSGLSRFVSVQNARVAWASSPKIIFKNRWMKQHLNPKK